MTDDELREAIRRAREAEAADPHALESAAALFGDHAPAECRCGWRTKPTTRGRGLALHMRHRTRERERAAATAAADQADRAHEAAGDALAAFVAELAGAGLLPEEVEPEAQRLVAAWDKGRS